MRPNIVTQEQLGKPPNVVEKTQNNTTKQYPDPSTTSRHPNAAATNHGTNRYQIKKLLKSRLRFGDYIDYRYYTISETPKNHDLEMLAERSGEPSTDSQRRWLIRRSIKFNKSTIDKQQYPEWYHENPQRYNSTRRPLPPSSTPDTYIHDPDYGCDPYHNPDLFDQVTLTFRETINVPFHDFVKKTNMNLDITKRKDVGNDSHPPAYQDEEQDPETQVIVTPTTVQPRSILKPHISNRTEIRSPPRTPSHKNEIRAAMTSSPSSPQSPEHPIKERTKLAEISIIIVPNAHKAGEPPSPLQNEPLRPKKQGASNGH